MSLGIHNVFFEFPWLISLRQSPENAYGRDIYDIHDHYIRITIPYMTADESDDVVSVTDTETPSTDTENARTDTENARTGTENARTDTENTLINLIRINPSMTLEELAKDAGLSKSGVRYVLRKLREKGIIVREGAQKNGKWIIRS